MCDYSLAHFPNRLALEGEQLVIHRFAGRTLGLAPARPILKQLFSRASVLAVCVPPGARLLLQDIPDHLQQCLGVRESEIVIFVERGLEAFAYRDGVRFANGREILLQDLHCGQRVEVLSLSPREHLLEEAEHQIREEEYRRLFVG
jgi:hypothetical protein